MKNDTSVFTKILKPFKAVIKFIVCHPIWSMLISWIVITFIDGYDTREWNFLRCAFLTLIIFALASPFIKHARRKIEKQNEIDYAAKKFAEEQDKIANPDKYKTTK